MGLSTDAIVAFGFDLGEDFEFDGYNPEDYDDGMSEYFDRLIGIKEWQSEGWVSFEVDEEIRKAAPVELVLHCSYDYPMYFLAVRGTVTESNRGYPVEFVPQTIDQEQLDEFKSWCDKHNIELPEDAPKWYVFSRMG